MEVVGRIGGGGCKKRSRQRGGRRRGGGDGKRDEGGRGVGGRERWDISRYRRRAPGDSSGASFSILISIESTSMAQFSYVMFFFFFFC